MTKGPAKVAPEASTAKGIWLLLVSVIILGLVLQAVAGAVLAAVVCGILVVAITLTYLAQGRGEEASRDPSTGLPDRAAAVRRLGEMRGQGRPANRQSAVIVVSLSTGQCAPTLRPLILTAVLRLSQGLRKGDQIVRVGTQSLAAILEPSRGLDAVALRDILDRMSEALREPFHIAGRSIEVQAAIGGCLEGDAPGGDARAWLEAAERAAALAETAAEPLLFEAGITPVDDLADDRGEPLTTSRRGVA